MRRGLLYGAAFATSINSGYAGLEYNGQNTFTLEHYDVKGDAGLYPHEGLQQLDDFSLNFSYSDSPYQTTRGYIQASSNHSDYREPHGTVIHNASVNYQTGELAIPLRLDVGDFYASQSRRTLQQGLKGVQLELQPVGLHTPQSIQFFWGRQAYDYSDFTEGDKDYYWGASWLIEQTVAGSFAITSVNYHNDRLPSHGGDPKTEEHVTSLAWEKFFSTSTFSHAVEAELAYLTGNNATNDSLNGRSEFLQLSGFGQGGKNYLLSYEKNNREYNPAGSALYSDREAILANWGQNLYGQMNLNLRAQQFRDYLSSVNPVTSKVAGINLVGLPFSRSDLNANLDVSLREVTDDNDTVEQDNWNARLDLSQPVNEHWRNRFYYQWQQIDDQVNQQKSHRRMTSLAADYTLYWNDWQTVLSPAVNYVEDIDSSSIQQDHLTFGLSINAISDNHSLLLSHQQVSFETENETGVESESAQTRLQWRVNWKTHTLAFNLDHYNYARDQEDDSDSLKVSLAWTFQFSKPKYQAPIIGGEQISLTQFTYLDDIQLNQFYDATLQQALKQANWSPSGHSGKYQLYEGALITSLNTRQVLALGQQGSAITDANLIIPLASTSPSEVQRLYRQVLDELLKTYGAPTRERSLGEFSAGWQVALNRNEFIRIVEWQTGNGVLRFGIPKPRMGGVRLELQMKDRQPALDSTDWGLSLAL